MKHLIVGDIHLDRNEETIDEKIELLKYYIETESPEKIFILGDLFDKGKNISTIASSKIQLLFEEFENIEIYILVGNHEIRFKNKLVPNSLSPVFKNLKNVFVIDRPTEIDNFLLCPWIIDFNDIDYLRNPNVKYCLLHGEINGFFYGGTICKTGLDIDVFKNFEWVLSGHFHNKNIKNNIQYIGSLTQETWNDYGDKKGYIIYDGVDFNFKYSNKEIYKHLILENEESIFDQDEYKDCHVKIFHKFPLTKTQNKLIDELIPYLRSYNIFDESIILNENNINYVDKFEFSDILELFMETQKIQKKEKIIEYLLKKKGEI